MAQAILLKEVEGLGGAGEAIKKPRQYSNTYVKVSKVGSKAKVTTTAHYKTTKTKKRPRLQLAVRIWKPRLS